MSQRPEPWIVDPDDPQAPPQDVWDGLTEEQRQHVLDSLPCYLGYLWPLWDAKRQTFADKIMSTVVVEQKKA